MSKIISGNASSKYSQKCLDYAKKSALKTASNKTIQKTAEAIVIWLVIKLLIKLQTSQELHHGIVQKKLKVKQKMQDLIQKYQKRDVYLLKRQQIINDLKINIIYRTEYQKIKKPLDNTPNQPKWLTQTYNTNIQTKFKTSRLKLSLCYYSDGYIHVTAPWNSNNPK